LYHPLFLQTSLLVILMTTNILILNGPNLNLLGTREPEVYGDNTLEDVANMCLEHAKHKGVVVDFQQSNQEGQLVDWIQTARGKYQGVIINAGAYTHTSVAIRDALLSLEVPIIELHISNVFAREEFRHHSYISDIATGVICGCGVKGYVLAMDALIQQ